MTNNPRNPNDYYPPVAPADQPHPPDKECSKPMCDQPPKPYEPPECPKPPSYCNCPQPPGETEHCLERLIDEQTKQLTLADTAKDFKAELEALLTKAKAASLEYTATKYDELVEKWLKQDRAIADLIRKVVCVVPCWKCVIECYVCPLLNELRDAEKQLNGDGILHATMHSVYDLRYWHERDKASKERSFQRIKEVLAAWEKPAQTIERILADNGKLLADSEKDPSKAVYDVFLKLIPMHLAIAPLAGPKTTTGIDKKYTEFCACDVGKPDYCCGPDVGELTLRRRLVGHQPYLVKPDDYFDLICCLVEKRYRPAKDALAEATAGLEKVENDIKRFKAQIENGLKDFEKNAKAKIPSVIDCYGEALPKPEPQPTQTSS